ncbi:MAG TPA: hypothetical protein VFS12_19380, partial [Terriglobia bacterium]|nr:hypothetical protein [Terriglobia bacterium]
VGRDAVLRVRVGSTVTAAQQRVPTSEFFTASGNPGFPGTGTGFPLSSDSRIFEDPSIVREFC